MTDQPISFSVAGWRPPPSPRADPISGRYCRLERLDADQHGPALFEAHALDSDGRNWTYLPQGPFNRYSDYYGWLKEMADEDDPFFFTILDTDGPRPIGVASYLRITPAAGTIEVGHIHYSPLLQKTRAASEAMFLMMKRAFALGYRRYEWKCDALNAPSRRAALRLGFSYEGIFRQATVYKERNRDTAWYAIIDQEWPELETAFESWLDPENFDDAGKQKTSLSSLTRPILKSIG